jgi:hypothetical protein
MFILGQNGRIDLIYILKWRQNDTANKGGCGENRLHLGMTGRHAGARQLRRHLILIAQGHTVEECAGSVTRTVVEDVLLGVVHDNWRGLLHFICLFFVSDHLKLTMEARSQLQTGPGEKKKNVFHYENVGFMVFVCCFFVLSATGIIIVY